MFEVVSESKIDPFGVKKRLVDSERGASMRRITGMGHGDGDVFCLELGGRKIPFETFWKPGLPQDGPGQYMLVTLTTFGGSVTAQIDAGIEPCEFASEAERQNAELLAIESRLVYGRAAYNGLSLAEGAVRVQVVRGANAGIYTLASFGIEPDGSPARSR